MEQSFKALLLVAGLLVAGCSPGFSRGLNVPVDFAGNQGGESYASIEDPETLQARRSSGDAESKTLGQLTPIHLP